MSFVTVSRTRGKTFAVSYTHLDVYKRQLLLRADARHLLVEALKTLPALEYQVLALHFYDEMNNREVAAILDLSEGYASRIRKRALESLAIHMNAALKGETVS